MRKRKNFGRKIRKSRVNLYPKRRTKAQKAAGTALLVIALLAIVFLGYCLGKPLLEYFGGLPASSEPPQWTPPEASDTSPETTRPPVTEEITETTAAEAFSETTNYYGLHAPTSALSNSASLSAFAAKASAEGYNAVIINLKDGAGYFHYLTDTVLSEEKSHITGALTAKQIYDILSEKGLEPIAAVSVLADNAGCIANPDMSYKIVNEDNVSWLDYTSGSPVRWSDPKSEAARQNTENIISELTAAGFKLIVLADIVFPDFQDYDREFIAAEYFAANRHKLLQPFLFDSAGVAVNAEDVISGGNSKTAEVLKNKKEITDRKIPVTVKISRAPFEGEAGFPADAAAFFEDIMSQLSARLSGFTLIPSVNGGDFTPDEISAMKEKSEEMGYKDFFQF